VSGGGPARELTPALRRTAAVARLLGDDLRSSVVFIGGAILPLLQVEPNVLGSLRPTTDVDGLTRALSYSGMTRLEEALRERGFKNDAASGIVHRWIAPGPISFDLVSCGEHTGGSGSDIEVFAWDHAVETDLPPRIRHLNGVGLLALKCAAYADRGEKDPMGSKDLADIASLLALRPAIATEVESAPQRVRAFVAATASRILGSARASGSIAGHLRDRDPLVDHLDERVIAILGALK